MKIDIVGTMTKQLKVFQTFSIEINKKSTTRCGNQRKDWKKDTMQIIIKIYCVDVYKRQVTHRILYFVKRPLVTE